MQIKFNDEDRVIFSGSIRLQEQIEQLTDEHFPFQATIVKENKELLFT